MKKIIVFALIIFSVLSFYNCSNEAVKEPVKGSITRLDTIPPIEWNVFVKTRRVSNGSLGINIQDEFFFNEEFIILNSKEYEGKWVDEKTFITSDSTQKFKVIWPYIFRSNDEVSLKYFIQE